MPANAVGLYAIDNDEPLAYKDTDMSQLIFDLTVVDDNNCIATCRDARTHLQANYLGCIVSADRTEVIWTNTNKPLP